MHHAHCLDGEDRQDAGHQIEDQAADHGRDGQRDQALAASAGSGCARGDAGRIFEHTPLLCRERVAGAGAVCGLYDNDPFEGAVEAVIGRGQAEGRAVAAEAERLARRMADFVAEGIEAEVGVGVEAAFGLQAEFPGSVAGINAGLALKVARRLGDPFADQGPVVDVRLTRAHRQGQAHFGCFGNADFLTDQIVGQEVQLDAAHRIGRNGEREWQDELVVIAVIHDLPVHDGQEMGDWPDERAEGRFRHVAAVQHPHLRRQSGVPGIAPIDVPAIVELHLDGRIEGFAGLNASALGDQFHHRPAAIHGLGVRTRHQRHQGGKQGQDETSDHKRTFARGSRDPPYARDFVQIEGPRSIVMSR